jgi:hypothetical protein
MTYGFRLYGPTGNVEMSSTDFSYVPIASLLVNPTTSGSQTFPGLASIDMIVVQTPEEPVGIDGASLLAFNSVNTAVYNSGADKVVSWSPGVQHGTVYNVNLFVLGY